MNLHRTEIPTAGVTRRSHRKAVRLRSVDVVLSTSEIKDLIQELSQLAREGRSKTGYHIHLFDSDTIEDTDRIEVTLFHARTYGGPHYFSETIVLKNGMK